MYDASAPAKRGLYLYGVVEVAKKNEVNRFGEHGYRLPKSVARVLKYVLDSLKERDPKSLSPQCRQHQIDYFHLEAEEGSETGWVKALSDSEKNNALSARATAPSSRKTRSVKPSCPRPPTNSSPRAFQVRSTGSDRLCRIAGGRTVDV
jgi:hypothetical protein